MNQSLTLTLKASTFAAIQEQAKYLGISPELLSVNLLEQQIEKNISENVNNAQINTAKQRFSSHFGKLNLDYTTSVENDSIDADLAQQYLGNNEDI
jgi:hypothetical protein